MEWRAQQTRLKKQFAKIAKNIGAIGMATIIATLMIPFGIVLAYSAITAKTPSRRRRRIKK